MAFPALARLECFDAASLKPLDRLANAAIELSRHWRRGF
jgi:hypothetical protein